MAATPLRIYTVGHSIRPMAALIELLRAHGVKRLVDVRTIPRSRRNPQFNQNAMPAPLAAAGVSYVHMPGLGGLRKPRKDSTNTAWRNDGFRGYADYMETDEFETNLDALLGEARQQPLACMCAEAVPWKCHRSLLSDALVARGIDVRHITSASAPESHRLSAFARVDGRRVTYPATTQPELVARSDAPPSAPKRRRAAPRRKKT